jgi:GT2 family glycosyltransferase
VIEQARVSELRNRGARQAEGGVLAFVDADNEIADGWVEAVAEAFAVENVGAAGALYRPPADGTWVQRAYGRLRGRSRGPEDVSWLCSGNLAVSRSAFEAIHGFDTSLETCEDVDLCNRLRARGFRIIGDERIGSIHHGDPKTLGELFRAELWRGRDNLRVSFRRPIAWSSVPSAILPVLDLGLLCLAVVGLVGWLLRWPFFLQWGIGAVAAIAAVSFLRVAKVAVREGEMGVRSLFQSFVAACVYDVARALALVTRTPHRGERIRATATSP